MIDLKLLLLFHFELSFNMAIDLFIFMSLSEWMGKFLLDMAQFSNSKIVIQENICH